MTYDVVVIGGGPAGMIAAGRAAELGAHVLLLEKNERLGKKLLITGGGRCNLTNAELSVRKMVAHYGPKGKALFGAFSRFGVTETLNFFHERGLTTKVENENRVFPASNKAFDVWKVLEKYLKAGKVEVRLHAQVRALKQHNQKISGVQLATGFIQAKNYILATGGMSRPETGSTGDGLVWLDSLGHKIETPKAALVPVILKNPWVKKLAGLSFPEVKLTSLQNQQIQASKAGKLLFTHFGLSGPLVLNMSQDLAELYKYGPVQLVLDLFPGQDTLTLDKKILEIFTQFPNKKIRNNLGSLVPPRMILPLLSQAQVDPEKPCNVVSKIERRNLAKLFKNLELEIGGFLGTEKAIVTSGGVALKEVDFKTMRSKLYPNLYLAGDILNFDRPSGGFSLQICWTTGYLAGEDTALKLKS